MPTSQPFSSTSGGNTALSLASWIKEIKPSAPALQEVRLTTAAQQFCATRLPYPGLNPVCGRRFHTHLWVGRSNQTMWNAIAGGTLVGAIAPAPIHELPRDNEQDELCEFGRWTRAAIPIGAGHRALHRTSFYGPPKGTSSGTTMRISCSSFYSNAQGILDPRCQQPLVAT